MYGLESKRALVLCGTRGIGLGIARCLARYGSSVTVFGTDQGRAAEIARSLPGTGNSSFACDFQKPSGVGDKVADTGPYDIIVLNSPGSAPGTVDQLSASHLQQSIDLMLLSIHGAVASTTNSVLKRREKNVLVTWFPLAAQRTTALMSPQVTDTTPAGRGCSTRGLPAMKRNHWGRLIAITSSSLSTPISGLAASSIARSAVQSYLKLLAESVGRFGITVNYVLPGKIDTDRLRSVDVATADKLGMDVRSVKAATLETIPLGRYGTPDDVGELVSFLASDQAAYITGAGIRCDGGYIKSI